MNDSDRFEQFTKQARKVLSLAQEEAERFNHNYIGTEHLLLGLVGEGEGVATTVLQCLGVELNAARQQVERIIGRGPRKVLGGLGLTPRCKKVIELAADEARRLNHQYLGTEHLLLGIVREGEGIAAGVLEILGVTLEQVRTQTLQSLGLTAGTTETTTTGGMARAPIRAGTIAHVHSAPDPTSSHFPAPTLRDALRVIPIVQQEQHEDVTLTAVALEVYADGCLLTLLIHRFQAEADPRDPVARPGEITVTMTDDQNRVYPGHNHGSSGVSRPGFWRGRAQYVFMPTLDPAAGAVRIEIAAIRWDYAQEAAPGEQPWVPGDVTAGPWVFSIGLPAAGP